MVCDQKEPKGRGGFDIHVYCMFSEDILSSSFKRGSTEVSKSI